LRKEVIGQHLVYQLRQSKKFDSFAVIHALTILTSISVED